MEERHPFHTLLPPQEQTLRRRALKLTSNEHWAEDLVQATFLKAWANRDKYKPDSRLRAWLFTILYNTFISDLRKSRREVEDADGVMAASLFEDPPQDHVLALNELISALAMLPNIQRRALMLMGAHGFSQLETADACGCSIGTIKSRVSRGRTALNRAFIHESLFRPGTSPRAGASLRPPLPPGDASDTALTAERIAAK